jgi:hypothetical protein
MAARCLLGSILSGLRLFPVVWPAARMGTPQLATLNQLAKKSQCRVYLAIVQLATYLGYPPNP